MNETMARQSYVTAGHSKAQTASLSRITTRTVGTKAYEC